MAGVVRIRTRAAVIGLLLFVVVAGAVVGWLWSGQDRGSLANWIAAAATVAAFLAATVAGWLAFDAFRLENDRDEARREDERRAQAVLVAAWPAQLNQRFTNNLAAGEFPVAVAVESANAVLRNASALPVTEIRVDFYLVQLKDSGDPASDDIVVGRDHLGYERASYLGPNTDREGVALVLEPEWPLPDPDEAIRVEHTVDIAFTDNAGRRWQHRTGEPLTLLRDAPKAEL